MRFRDILLEYDEHKTAERYGDSIRTALLARKQGGDALSGAVLSRAEREARETILGKSAFPSPEQTKQIKDLTKLLLVQRFEFYDNSPNKQNMAWLVTRFISGGIPRWEDLRKAGIYLARHAELRQSGYFKRNPEANAAFGDIGRLRTVADLGERLMAVGADAAVSNNEKDRQIEKEMLKDGSAELLFDNSEFKVVVPKTKEAAILFGRNTQWCTAASESDNMFADYASDGPLYIILHKPTNRRWQFHFETGQFMDENDRDIVWKEFPKQLFEHNIFTYGGLSFAARCRMLEHYVADENIKVLESFTNEELAGAILSTYIRRGGFATVHFTTRWSDIIYEVKSRDLKVDEHIHEDEDGRVILVSESNWQDFVLFLLEELQSENTFQHYAEQIYRPMRIEEFNPRKADYLYSATSLRAFLTVQAKGSKTFTKVMVEEDGSKKFRIYRERGLSELLTLVEVDEMAKENPDEWGPGHDTQILLCRAISAELDRQDNANL